MRSWCFIIVLGVFFQDDAILFDFNLANGISDWYVVNDGVMGGLSQGDLVLNETGHGVFKGYVTTENNGGFSSLRHAFKTRDISNYTQVVLLVKGDGKQYQFRMKAAPGQRYSYINTFKTSGDWETISIPLESFYPSFRGYRLDLPNFDGKNLAEIGILIGNKTNENFQLEIDRITLK